MKFLRRIFKYRIVRFVVYFHLAILIGGAVLLIHMHTTTSGQYRDFVNEGPYDAIIVPGLPFNGNSWSTLLRMRVQWSVYLYEKGIAKNIIYSGSAVYSPYTESEIMKAYAVAAGVPEEDIFTETGAEHSTENLCFSISRCEALDFEKIALATDPFQSYFLTFFASKRDIDIAYLPLRRSIVKDIPDLDLTINPQPAFVPDFVSLPERQGFFTRFKGTLGFYVDGQPEEE